jgi:hypothetical protein
MNPHVKVQVLWDVMTIESANLKLGFYNKRQDWGFYSTKRATSKSFSLDKDNVEEELEDKDKEITAESFFQHLSRMAPCQSKAS